MELELEWIVQEQQIRIKLIFPSTFLSTRNHKADKSKRFVTNISNVHKAAKNAHSLFIIVSVIHLKKTLKAEKKKL